MVRPLEGRAVLVQRLQSRLGINLEAVRFCPGALVITMTLMTTLVNVGDGISLVTVKFTGFPCTANRYVQESSTLFYACHVFHPQGPSSA